MPYIHNILIIMDVVRILMIIAAFWKPSICKFFLYYQMVYMMIRNTAPIDYGDIDNVVLI